MTLFPYITVIIGLGNPGKDYSHTYHNAGSLLVEYLVQNEQKFSRPSKKTARLFSAWKFAPEGKRKKIFILPHTFMNESGEAVKSALALFRLSPKDIIIAHDDSDLPLGSWKLSFARGSAGHHGAESVMASLRTKNFWRLRIGIRKTKEKAGMFVLKNISAGDNKKIRTVFQKIEEAQRNTIEN